MVCYGMVRHGSPRHGSRRFAKDRLLRYVGTVLYSQQYGTELKKSKPEVRESMAGHSKAELRRVKTELRHQKNNDVQFR